MALLSFLDRDRSIADSDFSRWLVPPAALAIHLCIGQVYALSVFKIPLSQLIGGGPKAPGNWSQETISHLFQIAIVFLGLSAAAFGAWLERVGPRRAMFTSACCFGGGFIVGAIGIYLHQFWLLSLGYGVLGGIGLGIGYISPVSTLIKWFPDRPGMATGMAIMGFGGGAMIASPLSVALMNFYKSGLSQGVTKTFLTMGIVYFVFMMFGVFTIRLPKPGWRPKGFVEPTTGRMITRANVSVNEAMRTPQFYLLWIMLCVNVTAGIGVIEQASPMIQEMFPGVIKASAAAGFVGLLSIANMSGRFVWSSFSDVIGRRATYATFFALGAVLYWCIPISGHMGKPWLFVLICVIVLTMYGGGFATIPAYLRDMFGTMQVGAIHGRLLTAWSLAGVLGPLIVNRIRESQIAAGVAKADAYTLSMHVMTVLLVVGFLSNLFVRPVDERHHYRTAAEPAGVPT
ncbi:MAG TPA: OFA family MFS transporter [Gemmatimonadaceae bacterium]|jgi:MFS family permease|nr:OFA family MFS transporter [Gemmatimonadaceae bacterium]